MTANVICSLRRRTLAAALGTAVLVPMLAATAATAAAAPATPAGLSLIASSGSAVAPEDEPRFPIPTRPAPKKPKFPFTGPSVPPPPAPAPVGPGAA